MRKFLKINRIGLQVFVNHQINDFDILKVCRILCVSTCQLDYTFQAGRYLKFLLSNCLVISYCQHDNVAETTEALKIDSFLHQTVFQSDKIKHLNKCYETNKLSNTFYIQLKVIL